MLSWVDCGPEKAHSIPGIIALLQEAALTAPAGVPIRGYGYEHRNLIEGRHPLKEELDQVATDREVYLMNASGHGGVVNSFTFDKHGIDASTENPAGGEFFRDEDGELTGELSDAACNILTGVNGVKVGHHGPNFHLEDEPEEHLRQLSVAQDKFLAGGVTTIGDCQVTRREFDMYLRLAEQDQLKTRVSMYMLSHLLDHVIDTGMHGAFGNSRLAFGGIKFYADGTLGGWTAYFPDGYVGDPCRTGQLYHEPADYSELIAKAHSVVCRPPRTLSHRPPSTWCSMPSKLRRRLTPTRRSSPHRALRTPDGRADRKDEPGRCLPGEPATALLQLG